MRNMENATEIQWDIWDWLAGSTQGGGSHG